MPKIIQSILLWPRKKYHKRNNSKLSGPITPSMLIKWKLTSASMHYHTLMDLQAVQANGSWTKIIWARQWKTCYRNGTFPLRKKGMLLLKRIILSQLGASFRKMIKFLMMILRNFWQLCWKKLIESSFKFRTHYSFISHTNNYLRLSVNFFLS